MISDKVTRRILESVLLFGALSSFGGAVMAVFFEGGGVPVEYLAGSPFHSFIIPGLVLGAVVGGTQLAGALALPKQVRTGVALSAVAGFGMLIWIFVEIAVIRAFSWLQAAYFSLGIVELVLTFALLGISPRVARPATGEVPHGTG